MNQFASVLFLAFITKITLISFLIVILQKKKANLIENGLIAWVGIQTYLMAWMLIISVFHQLTCFGIWIGLIGALLFLSYYIRHDSKIIIERDIKSILSSYGKLAFLCTLIVFAYLTYHSLYFFDNTWDGMSYEMPRIGFYAHYKTLFINQPTFAFNIFSNEWNGELNALFYVIATNNDAAMLFGNAEIWLLACFTFAWLAGVLGARHQLQLVYGFSIASIQCLLGLVLTVKGDALATVGLGLLLGLCIQIHKNEIKDYFSIAISLAALGLAIGTKIILLPCIAMLALYLVIQILYLPMTKNMKMIVIILGGLLAAVNSSRYIINLFEYHDPIHHIERSEFSLRHAFENLYGLLHDSFNFLSIVNHESVWVLSLGSGFVGIGLVVWAAIIFMFSSKRNNKLLPLRNYYLVIILGTGMAFILFMMPWLPWSYRYFLPWMSILFLMGLVYLDRRMSDYLMSLCCIYWLSLSSINIFATYLRHGEGLPVNFLTAQLYLSQMERKFVQLPFLNEGINAKDDAFKRQKILIYNQLGSAIYPFFGVNHENHVELTDSIRDIKNKIKNTSYDLIVFTGGEIDSCVDQAKTVLSESGYIMTSNIKKYRYIFSKSNQKN